MLLHREIIVFSFTEMEHSIIKSPLYFSCKATLSTTHVCLYLLIYGLICIRDLLLGLHSFVPCPKSLVNNTCWFGRIWHVGPHMAKFCPVWSCLGPFGPILSCLTPFDPLCLAPFPLFGPIWSSLAHSALFGPVRIYDYVVYFSFSIA